MTVLIKLVMALIAACLATQVRAECQEQAVHLNQTGFFTDGPKRAVVVSPSTSPVEWSLENAQGERVAGGQTTVFGNDPVSGLSVHRVDFSAVHSNGDGWRLLSACAASRPFSIAPRPYGKLALDALAYFFHNRSGVPISELNAGVQWARPAGHVQDVATCRQGEDRHGNLWPGCDYSLDVSGGWYDAGDHGKYVVNGGIAVWTLLNLHEYQQSRGGPASFADGSRSIPEAGNGVSDLLDEARFEMEFLLRMQVPEGTSARLPVGEKRNRPGLEFVAIDASGMAHHKMSDLEWTPLPMPPQDDPQPRVLFPVSTAATLNLAATAAQCARVWRSIDPDFAQRCLVAARSAWSAALRNPELYFIADFSGSGMYGDGQLEDEFFWAAAELFATTGDAAYLEWLRASPLLTAAPDGEPGWPRVAPLGLVTLATLPNGLTDVERNAVRKLLVDLATRFRDETERSGYHIPYAGDRYVWGSNSNLLNRAILLALAADFTADTSYRAAVIDVMDYLLGRNPMDVSYISGYGEHAMQQPHHRFWAPVFDTGLPPPPPGALSGGPNNTAMIDTVAQAMRGKCAPQTCWADHVDAYSLNEVAINWNAPLVWVSAWLQPDTP